jgi:Tat protein translocase TatB subunit
VINFPGPEKILMLAVIALVVLGPTRLPQAARTAGKWIAELRKLTSRFQEELSGALGDPKDAISAAVSDLTKEVGGWRNEVAGFSRTLTAPLTGAVGAAAAGVATPGQPATWPPEVTGANGATGGNGTYPAIAADDATPMDLGASGLAPLPPVPDDPSLN